MSDLNFQDLSTVQNSLQPGSTSIAGAATIAPTTFMTFITGTGTAITTITPPVTGNHMLILIFTNATPNTLATGGNIQRAVTPTQNIPVALYYNKYTGNYWAGPVS
jgi:hypothetical protein